MLLGTTFGEAGGFGEIGWGGVLFGAGWGALGGSFFIFFVASTGMYSVLGVIMTGLAAKCKTAPASMKIIKEIASENMKKSGILKLFIRNLLVDNLGIYQYVVMT